MAPPRTRLLGRCCRPYSYAEMIGRPRPAVNPQLCRRRLAGRCPNRVYAPGESRRGLASKTACVRNGARVLLATAPGTKPSAARIFANEYQVRRDALLDLHPRRAASDCAAGGA